MRKVGATVLAVPVIVAFYVASLRGRGGAHRLLAALGAAAVVAIVAIASLPPAPSVAVPASVPTPVTAQLLDAVRTGHPVTAPIEVKFDSPMDAASVAGALRVSPDSAINVTWDAAGRQLTIAPMAHWQPDTLYTVTIDTSARSEQGGRLDNPVRAVVLTTRAGTAAIAASASVKGHARTDAAITIHLDRPVPLAALRAALRTEPAIDGKLQAGATAADYTFTPNAALRPATAYRISLTGLVDADGVPFATTPSITVSTVNAPTVVRFRPFDKSQKVDRASLLSVRFTESMDHASTAKAFTVTAAGKRVAGTTVWAEKSHVLVFRPSAPLAYGTTVVMSVGPAATSRAGVPVQAASATFRVVPKPAPAAKPKPAHTGGAGSVKRQPISHSGGSGAVAGSWHAVESYYLRLMNCTRTGGWVDVRRIVLLAGWPECEATRAQREHLCARLAALCEATRDQQPVRPLHRRNAGRPPAARRLQQLPLGREPRLPVGQPVRRRPRLAPVLPERAAIQRRPLQEPDERPVRPRRDRRLGLARSRPAGHRLLSPLIATPGTREDHRTGDHRAVTIRAALGEHRVVIRNVVIHASSEQPLMADLYDLPSADDAGLLCTNLRMMDGKRPVFIDQIESTFFFPYHVIRFLEIPQAAAAGAARRGRRRDPEANDEPRELAAPEAESLLPIVLGASSEMSGGVDDPDIDIEIDEEFLQRVRDI